MSITSALKEKRHLRIVMPLAVILALFTITNSVRSQETHTLPQYDVIFSIDDNHAGETFSVRSTFSVTDGTLKIDHSKQKHKGRYPWKRLYLFNVKTQATHRLPFPFPKNIIKFPNNHIRIVPATKNIRLDPTAVSQDGYTFVEKQQRPYLRKGSSLIKIPPPENSHFPDNTLKFLGWKKP